MSEHHIDLRANAVRDLVNKAVDRPSSTRPSKAWLAGVAYDALLEIDRLRAALEWFADGGHYTDTYRQGAGFIEAVGSARAVNVLAGRAPDDHGEEPNAEAVHG